MKIYKNLFKHLTIQRGLIFLLLCSWWLVTAPAVQAAGPTCTVGGSGANYTTIQAALNDNGCATINVAAGTYYENLLITRNVTINGATTGSTIIDGQNIDQVVGIFKYNNYLTVTLTHLTFQHGNVSRGQAAGGVTAIYATVNLVKTTIRDNYSYYWGGGLHVSSATVNLVNSTVANNSNGGIYVDTGSLLILNSTVARNGGSSTGNLYNQSGTVTIRNSIVANPSDGTNCTGAITDGGHNLASDSSCNVGSATDPKLDPNGLQNNGGSTPTIALLPGSPAIDTGDDTICNADPVSGVDQRGVTRPQSDHCDIGAYEATATDSPIVTVSFPTPNGQNGWFTSGPVNGSVTAQGLARITGINCSGAEEYNVSIQTPSYATAGLRVNGDGVYGVSCTASDTENHSGAGAGSQNTATVKLDSVAPETSLTAQPANPSNSATATFSFTGSDATSGVASYQCQLDGGAFAACTSPLNYTNLSDGSHTFQVRAVDQAGNVDSIPASYSWTIDATAPTVTINQASGQADPTKSGPLHFAVVFSEAVTGFDGSDVNLSASTAAGTLVANVTGSGTTYDVAVSGMTGSGTVQATIPANAASDAAGNGNQASTSTDNSVSFLVETLINGSVTQTSVTAGTYNETLVACVSAGNLATQMVTPALHNNANTNFSGLLFKVKTLEYKVAQANNVQPKLCNGDTPGGSVGATYTLASTLAAQSDLTPSPAFQIGLPVRAAYRFFVDLYSTSATAATADGTAQSETYLGSFAYEFDPNGQLISGPNRLFLPLISR